MVEGGAQGAGHVEAATAADRVDEGENKAAARGKVGRGSQKGPPLNFIPPPAPPTDVSASAYSGYDGDSTFRNVASRKK